MSPCPCASAVVAAGALQDTRAVATYGLLLFLVAEVQPELVAGGGYVSLVCMPIRSGICEPFQHHCKHGMYMHVLFHVAPFVQGHMLYMSTGGAAETCTCTPLARCHRLAVKPCC